MRNISELADQVRTTRGSAGPEPLWPADVMARFWSKVDKSPGHGPWGDCWLWAGCPSGKGYGSIRVGQRFIKPHRFALGLRLGHHLPADTMSLHRCDVRNCCNPDHLFPGTHQDNMKDMAAKGRAFCWVGLRNGEDNPRARLTADQVRDIRALFRDGHRKAALAERFNVSFTTIHGIVTGRSWATVS